MYMYEQLITMQDIKSSELRDRRSNTNTRICFKVRATALRPRLHTEGFQLSTIGSSIQGPPLRNHNQQRSTQLLSQIQISTQKVGT